MKKLIIPLAFILQTINSLWAQQFYVSYKPAVFKGPFSGNVILYLSKKNDPPKNYTAWPCFRMKGHNIMPDQQIVFTDAALSYCNLLSRIPRVKYFV